ncbi:DUF4037 domain-containing protein [candidate division TA06 bacterium]|uniref:DUF4037 domain-containing protein n=1 Tax=candidate division TA06 bacterium TaxID=2250710 RepID=A0A523UQE2_UNCT6|nr:MAG: DUF4037 domain-containing protein [candidate division TA06 bacterium]
MQKDIKDYFEQTITPLIAEKYPKLASEMSILIPGSYGLGIADEFSDLDAVIYLDDPLWQTHGGQLQLMLEHCPHSFAKTVGHPEICVHPSWWLLNGHYKEFLENKADLPWEKVSIEDLYELQENLVLRDPHNIFDRLRHATAPERFPDWLWKKLLILGLKKLDDDLVEYQQVVRRHRMLESHTMLARVLEDLLHLGFILNKRYYPWQIHLQWAFGKLPVLASRVLLDLEIVISSPDWDKKLVSIRAIRDIYEEYIRQKKVLTPEILKDLLWAVRAEAWSNPHWYDRVTKCRQKAKEAGYDSSYGWVWSLWGWVEHQGQTKDNDKAVDHGRRNQE